MAACESCGLENRDGARFCDSCGTRLISPVDAPAEERKVVSVLFCDLVGFTASSHAMDPEDVSRDLAVYHGVARREIERFGGVVEKFIGDAVVGVWGSPVVHEDDAERAVRAALGIIDAVELDVRVAVNTGEAMVRMDPGADPGFGVVGDVVNTASRLQGIAPVGGVIVGEGTVRAVRGAISFDRLAPAHVKGKPEPVPVWRAVHLNRAPTDTHQTTTPLIGRAGELKLLVGLYERAAEEPGLQLVSLVGEPGIGKSRLVIEFERWLTEEAPEAVVRRGRCLAYGDGVGYWPLAEIIKTHAGISEHDSEEEATRKLAGLVDGMTDAAWLRARLSPLVGLSGEAADREQVFAAWRRVFDELATHRPLVLIVEDIHWAHPALLAFLRQFAERSADVPILVLCTARPELFEAHAAWGGDLINVSTLALRPLKAAETLELAHTLLPASTTSSAADLLAERCGGNPLYAEEYARLFLERTISVEMEMPDTLQALIAARIDTLPGDRKALLQDAAVIGKTFWVGAVTAIGKREKVEVEHAVHELARKELIRPVRSSGIPGDEEYSFWHDIVHEVVYRGIPRARRGHLHGEAARWIQQAAGERIGDRAELIAYHYRTALDLGPSTEGQETDEVRRGAVRHLAIAATRAMQMDAGHAERLARQGLDLAAAGDPEQARLLCVLGTATLRTGDLASARTSLAKARNLALSAGDWASLGESYFQEIEAAYFAGEGDTFVTLFDEAVRTLSDGPDTGEFAMVLTNGAFLAVFRGELERARELTERALTMGRRVQYPPAVATALNVRGLLRTELADRDGIDDLEESVAIYEQHGSVWTTMALIHLGGARLRWEGITRFPDLLQQAIDNGVRTHDATYEMLARLESILPLEMLGDWGRAISTADEVIAWADGVDALQHGARAKSEKARLLALQGRLDEAEATFAGVLRQAQRIEDAQVLTPALTTQALIAFMRGHDADARSHLQQVRADQITNDSASGLFFRLTVAVGDVDRAAELVSDIPRGTTRLENIRTGARALISEARGDATAAVAQYRESANRWQSFGDVFEEAQARAGEGRCQRALGHTAEAERVAAEYEPVLAALGVASAGLLIPAPAARASLGG
jgi:class 3 adenylate cyclase/tetratricopeptide (TPR) repeat protein